MARITSTNQLTQYALKVFQRAGWHCWRQNNGGVFDPKTKRFRANSSTPGIPDIIGFHRACGRFLAVEIKTGTDRLSAAQTEFLDAVKQAGGLSLVVRHADDLKPYLTTNEP